MTRVLIAGVSTRAAADSAARAGFDVTSLDGYADRDQHPGVRALALPRDLGLAFSARHAAAAAAAIACDAVAYLSNFENDPAAVATLAANRTLWGNPPDVLRRVRDPFAVAADVPRTRLRRASPLERSERPERSERSERSERLATETPVLRRRSRHPPVATDDRAEGVLSAAADRRDARLHRVRRGRRPRGAAGRLPSVDRRPAVRGRRRSLLRQHPRALHGSTVRARR